MVYRARITRPLANVQLSIYERERRSICYNDPRSLDLISFFSLAFFICSLRLLHLLTCPLTLVREDKSTDVFRSNGSGSDVTLLVMEIGCSRYWRIYICYFLKYLVTRGRAAFGL